LRDSARLGYDSQAIIREIYFTPARAKVYQEQRTGFDIGTETVFLKNKSIAWHAATSSHTHMHASSNCEWCSGYLHFKRRYPIESVLSSQEQDTGSESMKK